MRSRMLVAAGLAAGLVASTALAEDGYRHGRVFFVEPGVTLQRATEVSAEEALANLPFLPGDRVWTDSAGRAEFQFPDGTLVRLDRRSKLDYSGHEEGQEERVVLRLWSGQHVPAGAHARRCPLRGRDAGRHGPGARPRDAARRRRFRRDARERLRRRGDPRRRSAAGTLAAGERTYARWGGEAEEPRRFEPGAENDDFAQWDGMRESEERSAARSSEYLPDELDAYAGEFERNGQWQYEGAVGYVWVPRVESGWQPYSNGQWAWTPYGYTWVPNERWGWAPSHYGRWGVSASLGWYWMPGSTWGPGWVSWAVGGGYVGWCPLGWRDQPIRPWGYHGGHGGYAVSRGRYGQDPWNVVRHGDLRGRDVARRRVGFDQIDPGALRPADSVALRPTRDARSLRDGGDAPRLISRRQTPGDFVRELGVDNKTTIPAPWTHGYGPPPAGVDGARYGAQRRSDGDDSKNSRTNAPTAGSGSRSEGGAASARQSQRTAPWYAPRSTENPSGEGAGRRHSRPPRPEPRAAGRAPSRAPGAARNRAAAWSLPSAPRGVSPPPAALAGGAVMRAPARINRAPGVRAPAAISRAAGATAPRRCGLRGSRRAPNAARRVPPGTRAAARRHARRAAARAGRAPVAMPPPAPAATGSRFPPARPVAGRPLRAAPWLAARQAAGHNRPQWRPPWPGGEGSRQRAPCPPPAP